VPGGESDVARIPDTTTGARAVRAKDALGRYGEELAARHLLADGFVVLERNWRCDLGEVDILARDADVLVVCEVKTRRSASHGSPFEAVTERKLHRLERLGLRWMRERGVRPASMRVDVVSVRRPPTGRTVIEHVRGLR
jgi:putative endonuclease